MDSTDSWSFVSAGVLGTDLMGETVWDSTCEPGWDSASIEAPDCPLVGDSSCSFCDFIGVFSADSTSLVSAGCDTVVESGSSFCNSDAGVLVARSPALALSADVDGSCGVPGLNFASNDV